MKPVMALVLCTALASGEPPREPRVLFFHASWCAPCHQAIDDDKPNSFPKWLRASGWHVGTSMTDHVQLVDVDQRQDLVEIYGVTTIPAMVLIDGKVHKPVPYTGRQSLTALFEKPKPAAPVAKHDGKHSHTCNGCGTTWRHGPEAAFNPRAHNCPSCGRYQNVISGW